MPASEPSVGDLRSLPPRSGRLTCLIGCTLTDIAEDYALRTVEQVVKQVRACCGDDDDLYAKFTRSVRIVVVDGALQKVGQYMGKAISQTSC